MSFFARLEAACASAVERTFAGAFPTALEPVQIARKLVAAFEAGGALAGRSGRLFIVRVSPADLARFERDRTYLERQWSVMLAGLAERSRRPQRAPGVRLESDALVASGTVTIAAQALPEPSRLRLRVRKGMPPSALLALDRRVVVGREAGCDLVLLDARVSRRHVEIVPVGSKLNVHDLGSSNGTWLNGVRFERSELDLGDVLWLGDSELAVEAAEG